MKLLFIVCSLAILVAMAMAGTVTINGSCKNCSPPDAETLVVGGQVYKGKPGHGTVIIGSPEHQGAPGGGGAPQHIPEGFSGNVPGGYVHNSDCVNCKISGGDD